MNMATLDEPSEARLFFGWKIGAKRLPEREARDPRNGETVVSPEKITPYCHFAQNFKRKINDYNGG